MSDQLYLSPRHVLGITMSIIAVLLAAHILLVFVLGYGFDRDHVMGLTHIFNLLAERNVPTLYSSMLILFCSGLLFVIYRISETLRYHWLGLSTVFVLLAVDETVGFHEALSHAVAASEDDNQQFAWALPYLAGTAAVALAYLPLLKSLPRRFARLFVMSGALYVFAAAGLEIVAGFFNDAGLELSVVVAGTIEETLEMVAMAWFGYSLVSYLASRSAPVILNFRERATAAARAPLA